METITFDILKKRINTYNRKNIGIIEKAYNFARKSHEGQTRESGEEYISHPLNVAYLLAEMHADTDAICAALLHDVIEDTNITYEDILKEFSEQIANLVMGLTKLEKLAFSSNDEFTASNLRKILVSLKSDARIIVIKLADRLHNMRTLYYKKQDRQQAISLETLEIYVPLAYYIGAYKIKDELENIAFYYLKSDEYHKLNKKLNEIHKDNYKMLNRMLVETKQELASDNIKSHLELRFKDTYSVYKKMIFKSTTENIHDLLCIKVIVPTVKDCYLALMHIHKLYTPYSYKFKDYIVRPKTNMYRSLHTTVFGNNNRLVQFQIRTKEMDKVASYGLTSYWFKNKSFNLEEMQKDLKENFQFFKSIADLDSTIIDNIEFLNKVKSEIFSTNIYVRTTKGEVIELPSGSTPIDFAYKIHTDIGNTMVAAIVNDEMVNLDYELKSDDRIRIITDKIAKVKKDDWLQIAKTTHARRAISEYLKENN